jgi:hypothetical protein
MSITSIQDDQNNADRSSQIEVGECFHPVEHPSPVWVSPGVKLVSTPSVFEAVFSKLGYDSSPTVSDAMVGLSASSSAKERSQTEMSTISSDKTLLSPVEPTVSPTRRASAREVLTWAKRALLAETSLQEDAAELVSFWVVSTWFQDALKILPCLVFTGPAYDAMAVLRILEEICRTPVRIASFSKTDFEMLNHTCHTALISALNMDARKAALLGMGTYPGFRVISSGRAVDFSMSRALYAGEAPLTNRIPNSINLHIAPEGATVSTNQAWGPQSLRNLSAHLSQYREMNFDFVSSRTIVPPGGSTQAATLAAALGNCIVGEPELQEKVRSIFMAQEQRQLAETTDSVEFAVVDAVFELSRDGREHAYAGEIATEVNRLLVARGEFQRLSAEKLSHRLKKLGLRTCRLSQAGNGLRFDRTALATIKQLHEMHFMEDVPPGANSLHTL